MNTDLFSPHALSRGVDSRTSNTISPPPQPRQLPRAGSQVHADLPSRIGCWLHYRDGRVENAPL